MSSGCGRLEWLAALLHSEAGASPPGFTSRALLGSMAPFGTQDFPMPLVLGPQAPRSYGGSGEETGGGGGILLCQKYTRCFWNLHLFFLLGLAGPRISTPWGRGSGCVLPALFVKPAGDEQRM